MKINRRRDLLVFAGTLSILIWSAIVLRAQGTSSIRVLSVADAPRFQMGRVRSWRIVYPDMGARNLTFNYSMSEPGDEFPQHVHDHSDDTFLVLQGQVDVRQGTSLRPLMTGQAAFVPAGQIHGTITRGTGTAILVSFQCPPDMALYTGARDSSRLGAAPPKGVITPGAVKLLDFSSKDGFFTYPGMGSLRIAVAYRRLKPTESFSTSVEANGEEVLFAWRGAVLVKSPEGEYRLAEKQAAFVSGRRHLDIQIISTSDSIIIQAQSPPPHSGWDNRSK